VPGGAGSVQCRQLPPCVADSDCVIVSNTCQETATCAPAAGNWAVTQIISDTQWR